jgi:hypothetical protein
MVFRTLIKFVQISNMFIFFLSSFYYLELNLRLPKNLFNFFLFNSETLLSNIRY